MKKRILSIILCIIIVFSSVVISSKPVDAATKSQKAIKAYGKVIETYKKAYDYAKARKGTDQPYLVDGAFLFSWYERSYQNDPKMTPVYSITDLNKDGIPELIVGMKHTDNTFSKIYANGVEIFGVFTYKKNKANNLLSSGGNFRIKIKKGGYLMNTAEMVNYGDTEFYKYTKKSFKLLYWTNWSTERDGTRECKISKNGKDFTKISTSKWESAFNKYNNKKDLKINYSTINKNAIKAAKKGYKTYKAYKKSK